MDTINRYFQGLLGGIASLPQDKVLHALGGLIIFNVINLFGYPLISLVVVLTVAIVKEIYDHYTTKNGGDGMDVLATVGIPALLVLIERSFNG